MRFIDSHTHTFLRGPEDLRAMAEAGVGGVVVCAFLPVVPSSASTLRDLFRWVGEEEPARLAGCGLQARVALGIHPRCIPEEGLAEALAHLAVLCEQGRVAALGEVGLESGSAREQEVLAQQLRIAKACGAPIVLHTPRADKERAFAQTERILEREAVDPAKVVLDHLTPELAVRARRMGALAGLTLQPGKTTPEQVVELIGRIGAEGIVANSDLSHGPSDPLAVPRLAEHLERAAVGAEAIRAVICSNAAALLGF